jgi:hypothetical protein
MSPQFIPGAELCRLFFAEAVKPVIDDAFPRLRYAAALLGSGSEVLGFDTAMSTDHDWGPRVDLFLEPDDVESRPHSVVSRRASPTRILTITARSSRSIEMARRSVTRSGS